MPKRVAFVLVMLLALVGSALTAPSAQATTGASVSYHRIPGSDGASISSLVITPTGEGPFPLLVMPSSWSVNALEYAGAATRLAAESGYQVISYTSRGFHESGGQIDVAGPATVADVSAIIDWALANTEADPDRIGVAGISYGAGVGLLAAAADDRIRAVAAMSGWADLAATLYPNRTVSSEALESLLVAGQVTGRFAPEVQHAVDAYRAGDIGPMLALAPARSAANRVDQINANGAAVLIAHAWQDSLLVAGPMVDLYNRIDTAKRLTLASGDHATPEMPGAAGLPNDVFDEVTRWMDHHLRGVVNGIDQEEPVGLAPVNGGPRDSYPDWASVTATESTMPLSGPAVLQAGRPSIAEAGRVLVSGALQGTANVAMPISVPLLDPAAAAVWESPAYPDGAEVAGSPRLRLTATPSAADSTVVAYLYDVDRFGTGSLITHKPYSLLGAAPGDPQQIDLALEPTRWRLPAGHHLALVVDTVDGRYTSSGARGDTITLESGELTIPLGR